MLSVLALDTLTDIAPCVSDILKSGFERRELPIKRLNAFREPNSFVREAAEKDKYNVVVIALKKVQENHVAFAAKLRADCAKMFIVFVLADMNDVVTAVRPSVRPSGCLFIPLEPSRVYRTIREIYAEFVRMNKREDGPRFIVKNFGEQIFVDMSDIFFFEAREKKIAMKTIAQEVSFYSTFGEVLEQLPEWFIRCHKGFVVNTRYIKSADWGSMTITLTDGSNIPVSRTYKADAVAALRHLGKAAD